jgi:hypothetical protein
MLLSNNTDVGQLTSPQTSPPSFRLLVGAVRRRVWFKMRAAVRQPDGQLPGRRLDEGVRRARVTPVPDTTPTQGRAANVRWQTQLMSVI